LHIYTSMATDNRLSISPVRATQLAAIEGSLPFFFFGAAATAAGLYLLLSHTSVLSSRLPISGLIIAVGLMALAGGVIAAMIGDEVETPAGGVQAAAATPALVSKPEAPAVAPRRAAAPARTPVTAQKTTSVGPAARSAPSRPLVRRPIWEEDWDVNSVGFQAAASPPSSPDVVLRQIDELERLLRKKPARPPPD
jgi:hypothetical protein